jgi:1-acyl-sn-glycerol-3-phosphate acyltransferase
VTEAPPTPSNAPTRRAQKRARATARRLEARAAPEAAEAVDETAGEEGRATPMTSSAPTHRAQKRARATARRAEARAAAPEVPEAAAEPGLDEPVQASPNAPTHRAQKRARATARRAAAATASVAPVAGEEGAVVSAGASPVVPTSAPTKRSQKRARATARRAAAVAAVSDEVQVEGQVQAPKQPATPTKRSQKRARATARRATAATLAVETRDSQSGAEESVHDGAISLPEDERSPEQVSQGPTEGRESHPQVESVASDVETSHPEAEPSRAAEPEPEPEPEPGSVAATAASTHAASAAGGPAPRPRPRERDSILDAAMNLENDQTMLVRMTALVARIGARMFADVDVEGLGNIPRRGAVILAANHISNADGVVVGAWITDALKRRRIHWLGKREMFEWPVLGWMAAHGGVHPVDRDSADIEAFRLATKILEQGYVLLVFPEGTRSPTGELQEAKDGVAMLALRTGAQIVPIGVSNTDAVWRKGTKLPSPFPRRTVNVRIGRPFRVQDVIPPDTSRREAKRNATTEIMGRLAGLLDERPRGVYAGVARPDPTRKR